MLAAIADQAPFSPLQVDRQRDAAAGNVGRLGRDQRLGAVQAFELAFRQQRIAGAEAYLRQPRAGARDDREGARADLQIERAGIARRDLVELLAAIGHDAGEDVEPAGRALRIGRGRDVTGQVQAFQQRHDVDAAGLQHRAVGQGRSRAASAGRACPPPVRWPRQETGAHATGLFAEPEVEAGRLDLVGVERPRRRQRAGLEQRRDLGVGKDACLAQVVRLHPAWPGLFPATLRWTSGLANGAIDASGRRV